MRPFVGRTIPTDAEKRYDAERDGSYYQAQPEQPRSPKFYELKAWIDSHYPPLTADEEIALAQQADPARYQTLECTFHTLPSTGYSHHRRRHAEQV